MVHILSGDTQGPCAVGRFLSSFNGVEDKSGGDLTVLSFPSLGLLFHAKAAFAAKRQFYRLCAEMANRIGVPQEARLVEFFILDRMNSAPAPFASFQH